MTPMTTTEKILKRRVSEIEGAVRIIVEQEFGVQYFQPSQEDGLRLLTLSHWSFSHKVSIAFILRSLLPLWRESHARHHHVNSKGLGTSIATLCGKKSEEILIQKIAEAFPDHEHLLRWKSHEQEHQLIVAEGRQYAKEDWEYPATAVLAYSQRMQSERKRRLQFAQEQRRRAYRGNPWL